MGGVREWFGPIPVEPNEPVFHHPWEGHVFASLLTTIAMLGITEEAFRWTTERLPRAQYVAGYYQRWLATLEQIALDRGVLAPGELDAHLAGEQPEARGHVRPGLLHRTLTREFVRTGVGRRSRPCCCASTRGSRTCISTRWRHRGSRSASASRCPRHHQMATRGVRATRGESAERSSTYQFATVLPESSARGEHRPSEHFYTVEFDGRDLWGDDAEPGTAVRIDLFESYLEATS